MMKMKYKPYPKYKDSGIQWIGEIPERWEIRKLKFYLKSEIGEKDLNKEYQYLEIGDVDIMTKNYKLKDKDTPATAIQVPTNTLLISTVRPNRGAITITKQKINVSSAFCKLKLKNKFSFYYLNNRSFFEYLYINSTGSTYPTCKDEDIFNYPFLIPSSKEQTAIANFLDKKTAKIDALVKKDKKLIDLLKEKRAALINHVVTKGLPVRVRTQTGLDPNVKLKDSDIPWIGKIPEGWEVRKLKHVSYINKEKLDDNTNPNFKLNYLDISNVNSEGNIFQIEEKYFEDAPSRARRIPKENDTIISTVRTYLKAITYLEKIPKNLIVSTGFSVLEPFKNIIPKYLFYAVTSEKFIQRVIVDSKGVAYPAINPPELGQIYVIIPPKKEQIQIVQYLDKATAKIDKTVKLIEKKIELLEEYKKSLIHHVVTGKVDVRRVKYENQKN